MAGTISAATEWYKHRPFLVLALGTCWLALVYPIGFGIQDKLLQGSIAVASRNVSTTGHMTMEPSSTNVSSISLFNSSKETIHQGNVSLEGTSKPLWPPPYRFWNHTTQRMELPDDYNFPLDGRPSLVLLQSIIDSDQFRSRSIPLSDACYHPNIRATKALAKQVTEGKLNLSLPVLNVGMPKVGSSTLYSFFECSGWNASHEQNGRSMMYLVNRGVKKPLAQSEGGGYRQAYLQLDRSKKVCVFPQIQFLDEIHQELPYATFILNFRPVADWISSARSWFHLATRWATNCSLPGLTCSGSTEHDSASENPGRRLSPLCTDADLHYWWCGHVQHIRKFVEEYPSHKLIELDLYDNHETALLLSRLFGANESCWGHSNKGNQSNATDISKGR